MENFGDHLRQLRKSDRSGEKPHLGLTLQELSERSGIGSSRISAFERGARYPSEETLKRLAEGLGLSGEEQDNFVYVGMLAGSTASLPKSFPELPAEVLIAIKREVGHALRKAGSSRVKQTVDVEGVDVAWEMEDGTVLGLDLKVFAAKSPGDLKRKLRRRAGGRKT